MDGWRVAAVGRWMDGWMDEVGVCRLRYMDKTDGPFAISNGGPQVSPVSIQQNSGNTHPHIHTYTYAQGTQVDCLLDLYLMNYRGELISQ